MNQLVEVLIKEGFTRQEAKAELEILRGIYRRGNWSPEELLLDHGIIPTDELVWALRE